MPQLKDMSAKGQNGRGSISTRFHTRNSSKPITNEDPVEKMVSNAGVTRENRANRANRANQATTATEIANLSVRG